LGQILPCPIDDGLIDKLIHTLIFLMRFCTAFIVYREAADSIAAIFLLSGLTFYRIGSSGVPEKTKPLFKYTNNF
jgi:hypothetical protein